MYSVSAVTKITPYYKHAEFRYFTVEPEIQSISYSSNIGLSVNSFGIHSASVRLRSTHCQSIMVYRFCRSHEKSSGIWRSSLLNKGLKA